MSTATVTTEGRTVARQSLFSSATTITSDGWTIARRNLFRMARNPEMVIWTTIMPIMFIVLFVYVFGSNIPTEGISYENYVMAGIFAQTVVFGSANTGVGLAEDIQKGIIDRFRALPMSRSAVLVGRITSDLVNNVIVMAVMIAVGLAVGWRTSSSPFEVLGGVLLLLAFSYVFSWISATIGLAAKSVEVANSAGFIWMFPLTFISNIFINTRELPTGFRVFAEWNPLSALTAAARELFGNTSVMTEQASSAWPMENPVLASVLWMAVILAIFVPLSIRQFKRAVAQ
jgi:ABC-2 type transport system permease protein